MVEFKNKNQNETLNLSFEQQTKPSILNIFEINEQQEFSDNSFNVDVPHNLKVEYHSNIKKG